MKLIDIYEVKYYQKEIKVIVNASMLFFVNNKLFDFDTLHDEFSIESNEDVERLADETIANGGDQITFLKMHAGWAPRKISDDSGEVDIQQRFKTPPYIIPDEQLNKALRYGWIEKIS